MLFGGSDFERGVAIGGLASTVTPFILRLLGQILVAAITAAAAAFGKEVFAEYVRRNFKGRGNRDKRELSD
jgi:hypothetical protein